MEKIDIVLQGPMHPYTAQIADYYSGLPWVNNIIISCWTTCPDIDPPIKNTKISVLKNEDVLFPGSWNRNRLIKSSYEGLLNVSTDYCIKLRTDQVVSYDSMNMIYNYYFNNNSIKIKHLNDADSPNSKIGIMGICRDFPYHPVDHIFFGYTKDLINFFNIEHDMSWYDEEAIGKPYPEIYTRSEIYITAPYIAKFSLEAEKHMKNPDIYLKDKSEKVSEALDLSKQLMDEIFLVFPMIQMQWPKNGMQQYHYDVMATERGGHMYWAGSN